MKTNHFVLKEPILNEVFADNGEHSHWVLIDQSSGKKLWSEDPEENGHSPQDIWNAACQAQLELIAKTFSENVHKGDTDGYKVVFQAISETIKNHPKPVFNQVQEKTYTREEVNAKIDEVYQTINAYVNEYVDSTTDEMHKEIDQLKV